MIRELFHKIFMYFECRKNWKMKMEEPLKGIPLN